MQAHHKPIQILFIQGKNCKKNIELEIVSLMQYSSVIIAVILLKIFRWQNFSQIVLRAFFEEVLEGGGSIKVLHVVESCLCESMHLVHGSSMEHINSKPLSNL